jgi:hypothetical protein
LFFLIAIGVPLALVVAGAAFALWLPLLPVWIIMFFCNSQASFNALDFVKSTLKVMVYFYGAPVGLVLAIASVAVDAALAAPLYPVALVMVVCLRCKREPTAAYEIRRMMYTLFRWYFLVLCIIVYAVPIVVIAAAAAAAVMAVQVVALPRSVIMCRDLQSWDFMHDDCRSLFELFVHIIGTIPAVIIAAATFPLVFSLLVMHIVEQVPAKFARKLPILLCS